MRNSRNGSAATARRHNLKHRTGFARAARRYRDELAAQSVTRIIWLCARGVVRPVRSGFALVGLGAGLLLPTATNSVVGSVPQGDSGTGSASNAVALQVGGALGVAVIGSVLSTRYQDHMTTALAGRHLPAAATQTILGSLGGTLAVAAHAGAPPAPCSPILPAPRS